MNEGLAKFAISSSSSSSDEEDNEWEKREEYYSSRLGRRDSEEDREEELERGVLAEKKKKGKFETTPNGLLQLWKDVDDDADVGTTLSEFEELEYEDYDDVFDLDDCDDDDDDDDDDFQFEEKEEELTFNRNALVWLRPEVIGGSVGKTERNDDRVDNKNELLAWDAARREENMFSLLAPPSSSFATPSEFDFDVLYERAYIGTKELNFSNGTHGNVANCICAEESNLVTVCLNSVMGDASSRRLLRAILTASLDDSGALSVRFRGASVGATQNALSEFYETARMQNRVRAFATKPVGKDSTDPIANAIQKCILKILQAMDASLSAFAEACIQRRADEEGEYEGGEEDSRNAILNDAVTLLEFMLHTRDIRKQIASLAALVDKVKKRWRAMTRHKSGVPLLQALSPQRHRQSANKRNAIQHSYGSVALNVLSREIQDLTYNEYVDIELEQRSVLKLFEILFVSTVKPVLVEGIVNACFSSNHSSTSHIEDECLKSACDVLLQNKIDAIRKLRSIKNSTRDIHREEKLAHFRVGMRACKSLLLSSTSGSSDNISDATSFVQFFTKELGLARDEILREASGALDEAIDMTDTSRKKEKESIKREERERARAQRELFEARMRKHELEKEEKRQKAKAKKKELGDARRLEMFERAERKKEAKVNELTEDLERLGTFSGSAVKKRVKLLESQMNRADEGKIHRSEETGDVVLDDVVAVTEDQEVAEEKKEEEESKDTREVVGETIVTYNGTKESDHVSSISYSFFPSSAIMCKRSIVDVTASNLWAFLDLIHEKVSRVHVSYLIKDHEVASHANHIAEIIFGLSGDVIGTLVERSEDALDIDCMSSCISSSQITYFTNDELHDALERANISSNIVKERFRIVYSNDEMSRNMKAIKCLSYVLPEQLRRSNLFGIDFEEKIEAISSFVLRLKTIRAILHDLRKIANDLDRATYANDDGRRLDHALKEATVSRRRLRSFQEQLFEMERFVTHLERSCGENIRYATDVLNVSMNESSAEIDANDTKAMLSKWLNACTSASFLSKDSVTTRKVVEEGFRNIQKFAQQTFNAYNDADPSALLDNAVFISAINGLRGEFIGSVVRVFPF